MVDCEVPLVPSGRVPPEALSACHPQLFHRALGMHAEPGRCRARVLGRLWSNAGRHQLTEKRPQVLTCTCERGSAQGRADRKETPPPEEVTFWLSPK